jgi:hypothetical protein
MHCVITLHCKPYHQHSNSHDLSMSLNCSHETIMSNTQMLSDYAGNDSSTLYRIWIKNSDCTFTRTTKTVYGNLTADKAQKTCNRLNAYLRKFQKALHEAGMDFFPFPENHVPERTWCVYDNIGNIRLVCHCPFEGHELADQHDDWTCMEVHPLRK